MMNDVAEPVPEEPTEPELNPDEEWLSSLSDDDGPSIELEGEEIDGDSPKKKDEKSPTALVTDQWDRMKGEELATEIDAGTVHEWADLHTLAYAYDPVMEEAEKTSASERWQQFLTGLLNNPDCQALRVDTVHNEITSKMATQVFFKEWEALVEKDGDAEEQAEEKGKPDTPTKQRRRLSKAIGDALKKAQDEVTEFQDAANALGMGGDGSKGNSPLERKALLDLFKRIKESGKLKDILARAGRFRLCLQSKQREKVLHGMDDVTGVTLGNDVGRLLATESAKFLIPELEMDLYRRLAERQCFQWEYQGLEPLGKGPMIVVVDESGSMQGQKENSAKAFALALAYGARKQKRWCCLIGFSGGTEGNLLVLKPDQWNQAALLEWLLHFYNGGTDMDVPLVELPTTYWNTIQPPKGKTDVVLITDAICQVPDAMGKNFLEWKAREKVRMHSLILDNSSAGDLATLSDRVHLIRSISVEEAGIQECLSI